MWLLRYCKFSWFFHSYLLSNFVGFQYPAFKTHEINTKNTETHYMSNTKSNPDTLIAGFLLPWKVTNNSTGKEQPNNHKKPCAWILPVLQCLQNLTGFITLSGKFSQKNKKIDFSNFSNCSIFSTFRLFEFFGIFDFFDFSSRNLLRGELFDFLTFRLFEGKKRDFHGVTDTSQKSTQGVQFWPMPISFLARKSLESLDEWVYLMQKWLLL